MQPKWKYIFFSTLIGALVFAILAFAYVATISSVGVSHPHAPPALLVGAIAAIYSAPFGLIFGIIIALCTQKNYRRLLIYLVIAFIAFAALVTLAIKPR
ncbi:MAG: hypothetical protein U1F27_11405 [Turneriella sp.]